MTDMPPLILHSYWRSSAAYRVRIALNIKAAAYTLVTHDLRRNAQNDIAFRKIGIQGLVPVLEGPPAPLLQSLAIIEWLEERIPEPALLPAAPDHRALVRTMAGIIASDIHPLNNLRVLSALRQDLSADEAAVAAWAGQWIADGFSALEQLVVEHGAGFCFGDTPTMADCFLAPQIYSARRFGVDLDPYPALRAAHERAGGLPAFVAAHPDNQPDADR